MALSIEQVVLATIWGVLAAIVYSLRVLVLVERRVARVELHIERMANKIVREEYSIEKTLRTRRAPVKRTPTKRKPARKKTTRRRR